jgi:hypothetical protein
MEENIQDWSPEILIEDTIAAKFSVGYTTRAVVLFAIVDGSMATYILLHIR